MKRLLLVCAILLLISNGASSDVVGPPDATSSQSCTYGSIGVSILSDGWPYSDALIQTYLRAVASDESSYANVSHYIFKVTETDIPVDAVTGLPVHAPVDKVIYDYSNPSGGTPVYSSATSPYGGPRTFQAYAYLLHTTSMHNGYWNLQASAQGEFCAGSGIWCTTPLATATTESFQIDNMVYTDTTTPDLLKWKRGSVTPKPIILGTDNVHDSGPLTYTSGAILIYSLSGTSATRGIPCHFTNLDSPVYVQWDGNDGQGRPLPDGMYAYDVILQHNESGWCCDVGDPYSWPYWNPWDCRYCQRTSGDGGTDSARRTAALSISDISAAKQTPGATSTQYVVTYQLNGTSTSNGVVAYDSDFNEISRTSDTAQGNGQHLVTTEVPNTLLGDVYVVVFAQSDRDNKGHLTMPARERGVKLDRTPPNPGKASSPAYVTSAPFTVMCTGATDGDGSGVKKIELWVKKGAYGTWGDSGLTPSDSSFSFSPTEEGTYYFDLVAEDNAGNTSAVPIGNGDCNTIYKANLCAAGRSFIYNEYLYPGGPLIRTTSHDELGNQVRELARSYGSECELLGMSGSTDPVAYSYDAVYHIKSITDAANRITNFIYDDDGDPNTQNPKQGYLCRVEYPDGEVVRYADHDAYGRPLTRIDAKSVVTKYHYDDRNGLLTHIEYPATPALDVRYEYDPLYGRLTSVSDGAGVTTYNDYDDLDFPTSVTTTYAGLPAKTIGLDYWPNGNTRILTTPAGNFSYDYDGAGRPIGLTNPFSEIFSWGYYDNNWLQTQTTPVSVALYAYNQRGFLTNLTNRRTDQSLLSEYTGPAANPKMAYNTVGDILSMTVHIPNVAAQCSGVTDYSYEANRSQLLHEQSTRNGSYSYDFAYDPMGNPTTFEGASRAYNTKNQNTDAGFAYDANGNPTTYNGRTLVFDAENRMTSFGAALTAGYSGGGLRAWKESTSGRTYFLYSGNSPVCELDSSGNVIAVNTFGPAGLLARREGGPTQGSDKFYMFDPHGNASQILDVSGNVVSTQLYDAYGTLLYGNAASPYGFGGQYGYYTDQETGLQLLSHRYYDSEEGRFLTRDPIGYAGGQNLYSYVQNNPVNAVDASGFCKNKPWWEKLAEGRYYGTSQGETARDWYAQKSIEHPWNLLYWGGGLLSSLWTPETYQATATTIATAGSLSGVGAVTQAEKTIAQVTINRANGLAFEDAALSARGIVSNGHMVAGRTLSGSMRNTVLDSMEGGLTEVKNVAYQSYTKQLQAQLDYAATSGQRYELIVNTGTKVSGPLQEAIRDIGTITRFDPTTGVFLPY